MPNIDTVPESDSAKLAFGGESSAGIFSVTSVTSSPASIAISWSEPCRRASILRAITRFFSHYAVFSGRASRSEYWWIALLATLGQSISVILYVGYIESMNIITACGNSYGCPPITNNDRVVTSYLTFLIVVGLVSLAFLVPTLALSARRLHDSNHSAHLLWLAFVPILGPLTIHALALTRPNLGGQRFDRK